MRSFFYLGALSHCINCVTDWTGLQVCNKYCLYLTNNWKYSKKPYHAQFSLSFLLQLPHLSLNHAAFKASVKKWFPLIQYCFSCHGYILENGSYYIQVWRKEKYSNLDPLDVLSLIQENKKRKVGASMTEKRAKALCILLLHSSKE